MIEIKQRSNCQNAINSRDGESIVGYFKDSYKSIRIELRQDRE